MCWVAAFVPPKTATQHMCWAAVIRGTKTATQHTFFCVGWLFTLTNGFRRLHSKLLEHCLANLRQTSIFSPSLTINRLTSRFKKVLFAMINLTMKIYFLASN